MGKKVISAGHICIDITPVIPDRGKSEIGDVLRPGKLIQTGRAQVSTGGSVANTGLGMKILGADVTLMGKIGEDEFGDMICGILDRYGASDGMIRAKDDSTSYSIVLAIPGIDRIFLHNPGANDHFCAEDVTEEALSQADHFHFGYPPLMRSMYENDGEELVRLFKRVKTAGLSTSLDLAAVDPDSPAGKLNWRRILERVIPFIDFFVPSIEELCFMLDRERFENWQTRAGGRDITEILDLNEDIRPLADQCMALGAKVLLLKCGAPGMYLRTASEGTLLKVGEKTEFDAAAWADCEFFEKSYKPERILSGTGAGDTSIAAFLTAMLQGEKPEVCMQMAVAEGACCVASYDALSGLKPLEELKKKIAGGWEKCW
ncbi:MAG: carbohydrate kinase family protein [Lachnospiraceae bacterium]|nr:carbohydrate kinase family protein [Lachnospiraceae bacterium]